MLNHPVTKWERWYPPKDGKPGFWGHNHMEFGHTDKDQPTPLRDTMGNVYKAQSGSWNKEIWRKTFGYLVGDNHIFTIEKSYK